MIAAAVPHNPPPVPKGSGAIRRPSARALHLAGTAPRATSPPDGRAIVNALSSGHQSQESALSIGGDSGNPTRAIVRPEGADRDSPRSAQPHEPGQPPLQPLTSQPNRPDIPCLRLGQPPPARAIIARDDSPTTARPRSSPAQRSFDVADLLELVLDAMRPTLRFDVAVAVLCEDGRHVVPVYAAGPDAAVARRRARPGARRLRRTRRRVDHAAWPERGPRTSSRSTGGACASTNPTRTKMRRSSSAAPSQACCASAARKPLTRTRRDAYFAMASDISKAIERLDAQRVADAPRAGAAAAVGEDVQRRPARLRRRARAEQPAHRHHGLRPAAAARATLDETPRRQVETIYGEAERASKIVSNLLTFARRRKRRRSRPTSTR